MVTILPLQEAFADNNQIRFLSVMPSLDTVEKLKEYMKIIK
jgi:PHP family Zn ribbon phosphoesterase